MSTSQKTMSYERYLDEVTTIIYEDHDMDEQGAIDLTMQAQERGYFVKHDDDSSLRTERQAKMDAQYIFSQRKKMLVK